MSVTQTPFLRTKILTGFIIGATLLPTIAVLMLFESRNITTNVETNFAQQKRLHQAQQIIWLDEVLTHSVRSYVFTGDEHWKQRYDKHAEQLDAIIVDAQTHVPNAAIRDIFMRQGEANDKLVELELQACEKRAAQEVEAAQALLEGENYQQWKQVYAETIQEFLVLASLRHDLSQDALVDNLHNSVRLIIYSAFAIILIIVFILLYAWSISREITRSRNAANQVVEDLVRVSKGLAAGDLSVMPEAEYHGDFAQIKAAQEQTLGGLRAVMQDIIQISEHLAEGHLQVAPKAEYPGELDNIKTALLKTSSGLNRVIQDIIQVSEGLAEGRLQAVPKADYPGDLGNIKAALLKTGAGLDLVIEDIVQTSHALAKNKPHIMRANYHGDFGEVKKALQAAAETLSRSAATAQYQDWLKTGQTGLNEAMTGDQALQELTQNIINFLCRYLDAKLGIFYIAEKTEEETQLRPIATYACTQQQTAACTFHLGEGLVGEVALKTKALILNEVPNNYLKITSGLGQAVPHSIVVQACFYEQQLKGVLELGFINAQPPHISEFLQQVLPTIGIAINSAESRQRMQTLLEQQGNRPAHHLNP